MGHRARVVGRFLQGLLAALVLSACGGALPTAPSTSVAAAPAPPPSPKVIVISVDGLHPDAITSSQAPNIRSLVDQGASTFGAQTIDLSNTLPSHVSMLSGYPRTIHKVNWDDYLPAKGGITVPTVFSATRSAGLLSVMVVGKHKFAHFQDTNTVDTYVEKTGGDDDVANEAVSRLYAPFDFMFVHLPGVDLKGHEKGWLSRDYVAQVGRTDAAIGRIVSAIPPYTTVILTADHAGHDRNHGTNTMPDTTIPWIIVGEGVVPGQLAVRVSTMDTAATVAHVLGLRLPATATGRPVFEAFTPR